jgi:cell wall-associated NlpC family hydrolase
LQPILLLMRRLAGSALLVSLLALLLAGLAASAGSPAQSWAAREIRAVVSAGAMGLDGASFRPDDPVTAGELSDALVAVGRRSPQPADPDRMLTMRELDAKLVAALGLRQAATRVRVAARDAGLRPIPSLGTETVARLLGLRLNHPVGQEELERAPNDLAPRAEAAYSLARVLELGDSRIEEIAELTRTLAFPELDDQQAAVVSRALRFVGYPYVFAGTSERQQEVWSSTAPGGLVTAPPGFDCSGLVWRVYKLQPLPLSPQVATVITGRTTFAMSGEVPAALRIGLDELEPGDIVFFGARGVKSKPSQVTHSGIYVGAGWFVHSSTNGVTLQPLSGWYETRFAWGRRPLAEASAAA